jgi:predicted ATPase
VGANNLGGENAGTELPPRLTSVELHRFKGFREFTLSFGDLAVLIGPNNAGKSSVVGALAATSHMLRVAMKFKASTRQIRGERVVWAHQFTTNQVGLDEDSLRWESRDEEAQIRVTFANGARLIAVWPSPGKGSPYFFIQSSDRRSPREPSEVRSLVPAVDVVPALAPLERNEELHDARYVRDTVRSRNASRNFRNQLLLCHNGELPGCEWGQFQEFLHQWLPEIVLGDPELGDTGINIYYREEMTPAWKEIVWAGDGFQVFLQNLFHLYRLREARIIVLDEPDVYLHADLQRRLIQVTSNSKAQLLVATHSAEIAAEVGTPSIVWMDRTRSRAVRAPSDDALSQISGSIGSQFNLRLARALRARLTLFVEGDDAVYIKRLAQTLGCISVANERNLAIVPIEGRDNWKRLEGIAWLNKHLLEGSVESLLVVDRDYHSTESVDQLRQSLSGWGVALHVWERKEIESYLLCPPAMARASGTSETVIKEALAAITLPKYEEVLFQTVATWKQDVPEDRRLADATVAKRFVDSLRKVWQDPAERLWRCGAKDCLSELNQVLASKEARTLSFDGVVRHMRTDDIPPELTNLVRSIERKLKPPSQARR